VSSDREWRLWLIGQGIGASPSPAMHEAALRASGLRGRYSLVEVPPDRLAATVDRLRRGEADGANVTIPHKRAVAALCDRLEGDAEICGAVNTLIVDGSHLVGANTDAQGFELALRHLDLWPQPGAVAVVLGAGGAAAATALALARVPCDRLFVVARRAEAATALCRRLAGLVPALPLPWDGDAVRPVAAAADVIVQATPAPARELPLTARDLPETAIVVDLRYRPRPVDLVAEARALGRRACDGVEMLLCQGMLSFERWTGRPAPWEDARAALFRALQ
jgi:shikimate dehydrogenase